MFWISRTENIFDLLLSLVREPARFFPEPKGLCIGVRACQFLGLLSRANHSMCTETADLGALQEISMYENPLFITNSMSKKLTIKYHLGLYEDLLKSLGSYRLPTCNGFTL